MNGNDIISSNPRGVPRVQDETIVFPTPSELLDAAYAFAAAPFQLLASRTARRVYIVSFLLALAGLSLVPLSTAAYGVFYFRYVPQISLTGPIHLQFNTGASTGGAAGAPHTPHGVVDLGSRLVSQQAYDVYVHLSLPRAEVNLGAGNFMLDVALLAQVPSAAAAGGQGAIGAATDSTWSSAAIPPPPSAQQQSATSDTPTVLAHARRPALLTYASPMTENARSLLRLPLALLLGRSASADAETLVVQVMDGIVFPRGWKNVPRAARVTLESSERLWVYSAELEIRARLSGLRYLMYNYRVISATGFTFLFWAVSMASVLVIYALFTFFFSGTDPSSTAPPSTLPGGPDALKPTSAIKREDEDDADLTEDMSDTSRGFPTYSRQPPLRYSGRANSPAAMAGAAAAHVKREDDGEFDDDAKGAGQGSRRGLSGVLEADDEDDEGPGAARARVDDEEEEDVDFVTDGDGRVIGGRGTDSGLGTSLESGVPSSAAAEALRRRRSGKGA